MRIAKSNLKKQSQFVPARNDAKSIITMVYGDFDEPGQRKNKAKQSQFQRYEEEYTPVEKAIGSLTPARDAAC